MTGADLPRSPLDGRWILSADEQAACLRDVSSGKEVRRLQGTTKGVSSVVLSADGKRAFVVGSGGPVVIDRAGHFVNEDTSVLWDLTTGSEVRRFARSPLSSQAALSPDGRWLATDGEDSSVSLWDLYSGRELRRFGGHHNEVNAIAFSPDGLQLLTGDSDTAHLWDVQSGREVKRFEGHSASVTAVAFSPDGRQVVTGSLDHTARLWNVESGLEVRRFEGHSEAIVAVAFSPDGRQAITGGGDNFSLNPDNIVRLWDVATGREIRRFQGHASIVTSVAFSPDGNQVLSGGWDQTARLWDVTTGNEVRRFEENDDSVNSVAFMPDGRWLVTASSDGTVRIYNPQSGTPIATMVSYREGGWAVVDPEGRYDASDPDNSPGLYWLVEWPQQGACGGTQVIELKQLKERFYTPGLLARKLGFNREPLPSVAGLDRLQPWPIVEFMSPAKGDYSAQLKLTDCGGGIGNVQVKVNGRAIPFGARKTGVIPAAKAVEVKVELGTAELESDGNNRIEVTVFDRANLVSGRGFQTRWNRAPENAPRPPTLHAITVGISNFDNPKLNLTFAADDALDIAEALQIGGKNLFGVDRVDIKTFASGTNHEPTKKAIQEAFREVADHAGSNDVLLVYFAGHGVAGRSVADQYYFLTREARSVEPDNDPQLRSATSISSEELRQWLGAKGMPLRQVVVLDTCAAGQAAAELIKLAERRELTADQRRAIELLKDRTGSHILMGATADEVSYEASRYGQGLLTYALLSGMRGEALDEGGRLEVRKWFDVAERRVPELALGIGGIQQPVVASTAGQSFPIALLTKDDFPKIPVKHIKPQLLRAVVLDEDDADRLELGPALRAQLRAVSTPVIRGDVRHEQPLIYLDQVAGDVADAYVPQVRYWSEGDSVRLRLRLLMGNERTERTLTVRINDRDRLARTVSTQFEEMLGEK